MKFNDLHPGSYAAQIKDFGTKVVTPEMGDKVFKAVVALSVQAGAESVTAYWEGFWFTREGQPNQRTIKTLLACGFNGRNPNALNLAEALDTSKTVYVTVNVVERNGKTYNQIEWINDAPGGGGGIQKEDIPFDEDLFNDAFLKAQDSMQKKPASTKVAPKAKTAEQKSAARAKQAEQKAIDEESFPL